MVVIHGMQCHHSYSSYHLDHGDEMSAEACALSAQVAVALDSYDGNARMIRRTGVWDGFS